jgi:hypothetical protein
MRRQRRNKYAAGKNTDEQKGINLGVYSENNNSAGSNGNFDLYHCAGRKEHGNNNTKDKRDILK